MKGSIFTDQKCFCNRNLKHDPSRRGCFCPVHKGNYATRFIAKCGKRNRKRTTSYDKAESLILGWNFDPKVTDPLALPCLTASYLKRKKVSVSKSHYRNISKDLDRVVKHFGARLITSLGYAEWEDFFFPLEDSDSLSGLSRKTVANIRSTVSDLYNWLILRGTIDTRPTLPSVKYVLGWRNRISRAEQRQIIAEVYEREPDRAALAIRMLATYINVRPGELIQIKEGDINLSIGVIRLKADTTKEGKDKIIYLTEEDIRILSSYQKAMPHVPFFRHFQSNGGAKAGDQFSRSYLYRCWKRAANRVGIEGVDLYGGTRHSTVAFLKGTGLSPEQIKRMSQHKTNAAFERYLQEPPANELQELNEQAKI